jgi:subtilisin family serine protease
MSEGGQNNDSDAGGARLRGGARYLSNQATKQSRIEFLERLRGRREGLERVQFYVDELDDREVLPIAAELLVEAGSLTDRARELIEEKDFDVVEVDCLRDKVARLTHRRRDIQLDELKQLRAELRQAGVNASLAYVTPNKTIMKADETPDDVEAGQEPPTFPDPPEEGHGESDVRVAILDTGINTDDRDDQWLGGLQTSQNRDPLDELQPIGRLDFAAGHGTFIAGLYQQENPGLILVPEIGIDSDGIVGEVEIACALVSLVEKELRPDGRLAVNLSFGTDTDDDNPPLALKAAVEIVRDIAIAKGGEVLLVAAAGNDGADRRCWPAAFAGNTEFKDLVVAVAALNKDFSPAPWSTRGAWVTCSAIGQEVVSTFVKGTEDQDIDPSPETFHENAFARWTGTSFSAPKVAARIANLAETQNLSLRAARDQLLHGKPLVAGYGAIMDF